MNNEEKLVKALEALQAGQANLIKTIETLQQELGKIKQAQSYTNTALKVLLESQQEIRETLDAISVHA